MYSHTGGLLQVGSHRGAPAGAHVPQVGGSLSHCLVDPSPPSLAVILLLWMTRAPPERPAAGQEQASIASVHFQPKAQCTSHLNTNQEGEIALFLSTVEKTKPGTPKAH